MGSDRVIRIATIAVWVVAAAVLAALVLMPRPTLPQSNSSAGGSARPVMLEFSSDT